MSKAKSNLRVLVVDDNLQTQKMLRFLLRDADFEVHLASGADEARSFLDQPDHPIHLLLLDVMMPNLDGFEFCNQLRREGRDVPIVFLSARGDSSDRVQGLRMGGDDYVLKPFDPNELLARVNAVLRRSNSASPPPALLSNLSISGIELDSVRLQVRVSDHHEADLTLTETKLLHCLMRNAGHVLSRGVLINQVWDYDYDGYDNTVDVYIRRLRKKVEPNPDEPRYIRTVRGVGYVFQK
jgi:DNA-binding response OmpR family regulator